MDPDHNTSTRNRANSAQFALSLLSRHRQIRPYQAYCVTEASSRPPSPDAPSHRASCRKPSWTSNRDNKPPLSRYEDLSGTLQSNIEQNGSSAIALSKEKGCNGRSESSNQNSIPGNTEQASKNHITRAVCPRGSHPLVACQTVVCDLTPSQLRVRPSVPSYVATSKVYQRKSLPRHARVATMEAHPLPALPKEDALEEQLEDDIVESKKQLTDDGTFDLPPGSQGAQSDETGTDAETKANCLRTAEKVVQGACLPTIEAVISSHSQPPHRSVVFQEESIATEEPIPRNHELPSQSSSNISVCESAQYPSSPELYSPRLALKDMDIDKRAYRRTQPKDTKLRYQFGRRPSFSLDVPPPTPTHRHLISPAPSGSSDVLGPPQTNPEHTSLPTPSLSVKSLAEPQAGPRRPPWISFDNLEAQRRSRIEAREREEMRKLRLTWETTTSSESIRKGYASTASIDDSPMRREVEEYREQVLRLYPDMEFDAGRVKKRRGWWWWRCCCFS